MFWLSNPESNLEKYENIKILKFMSIKYHVPIFERDLNSLQNYLQCGFMF